MRVAGPGVTPAGRCGWELPAGRSSAALTAPSARSQQWRSPCAAGDSGAAAAPADSQPTRRSSPAFVFKNCGTQPQVLRNNSTIARNSKKKKNVKEERVLGVAFSGNNV